MDLKNSVSISANAIGPGKSVQGIALWNGIDPAATRFTLYIRGLSNGYFVEQDKTFYKMLEIRFQRAGAQIRPVAAGEWIYRKAIRAK